MPNYNSQIFSFNTYMLLFLIWSVQAQKPFQDVTNKLWGYKNRTGNIIIEPQFCKAFPFSKTFKIAIVKTKHSYTFITSRGKVRLKYQFESLGFENTSDGFLGSCTRFKLNGSWGLITYKGKVILPNRFQAISFDSVNSIFITKAKMLQLYTVEGTPIKHPQSSDYQVLKPNYYALKSSEDWLIFKLAPPQVIAGNLSVKPVVKDDEFVIKQEDYYRRMDSTGQVLNSEYYKSEKLKQVYSKYLMQPPSKFSALECYADTILELAKNTFAAKRHDFYRLFKIESFKLKYLKSYKDVKLLTKTLIAVKVGQFWGMIDLEGQYLIPAKYLEITKHNDSYLKLLDTASKYHIFDLKKRQWFAPQHHIIRLEGKLFLAQMKGYYGYLDSTATWIIPPIYDHLSSPVANWITAKKNGYFGIIDTQNNIMINFLYDSLRLINQHYVVYFENAEWGTYSRTGLELARHTCTFRQLPNDCLKLDSAGKQGFVNYYGRLVIPTRYDSLADKAEGGLLALYQGQDRSYMDLNSTILPPSKYTVLALQPTFTQAYIPALGNNKAWGFIDYRGRWLIANRYDSLKPFSQDYAPFKLKKYWGYIDKDEQILIQPLYQSVSKIHNHLAIVRQNNYWGILNLKTKTYLISLKYDSIGLTPRGNYILSKNNRLGWFNPHNFKRIYPKYDSIEELDQNFLLVEDNGKKGVDRSNGRNLFLPRYKSIVYFKQSNWFGLQVD